MLVLLIVLQSVTLLMLLVLLLRRGAPAGGAVTDQRLEALLTADLPAKLVRLEARSEGTEQSLRSSLSEARQESSAEAARAREAAASAAAALRTEVTGNISSLGKRLEEGLDVFRADNKGSAENLRNAVGQQLTGIAKQLTDVSDSFVRQGSQSREVLQTRLDELGRKQAEDGEKLRGTVELRLDKLSETNAARLDEMRKTVDEKLDATLHTRLTESFGQVSDSLSKVHKGLGEMNTLSTGVQDLNRLFSNVKSRGGFAEVYLGNLLEQVLAPSQYIKDARVKKGSLEVVEYAVRFPGASAEEVLLPIDAKFPREDWERLESAYEGSSPEAIESARKAFDRAIRIQAKTICEKYIHEPVTTPYAIMFLPTEGLYAEVLRRDGLQSELHQQCRVMVAGPSNLYALLTSFQLGFRMLNLQKKGNEVWKVLGETKTEFQKFGGLMDKVEKKFGEVQNTFSDLNRRSRAIDRKLRDVSEIADDAPNVLPIDGFLPQLAAGEGTD